MKCKSEIRVYGDTKQIIRCFEAEEKRKEDRSRLNIVEKKDHVLFEVEADDPTALRATLNGITRLLIVFEKMEKI